VSTGRAPDRVLRRALIAGAVTWSVVGGALGFGLAGGGGAASAAGVSAGLVAGAFVASGWLLLALGSDVVAGTRPPLRRAVWTFAALLITVLTALLALSIGQQAAIA
jgi:hypothetical protein